MTPAKKAPPVKPPIKAAPSRRGAERSTLARKASGPKANGSVAALARKDIGEKSPRSSNRGSRVVEHPERTTTKVSRAKATRSLDDRRGAKTTAKSSPKRQAGPYDTDTKFLADQRALLERERSIYEGQAADLKAEADSLAQEREPGDVQFDEESGEGGTVAVDRERDLALSAQALAAVEEIDVALGRISERTYGACERCHQPIPKPRLRALPYARLCVACKSGGLGRR